jgi:hypothetical protein
MNCNWRGIEEKMRIKLVLVMFISLGLWSSCTHAQRRDVPVPSSCSPQVNDRLQEMIRNHPKGYVENVMACGIATGTRVNHRGQHGSHHIIALNVMLPQDGAVKIQIVINDRLDGVVSANAGDSVFAYGQGYVTSGPWAVGITMSTVRHIPRQTTAGSLSME